MSSRRLRLRAELLARRETILKDALARPSGPAVVYAGYYRNGPFEGLDRRAPALRNPRLRLRLQRLLAYRDHWLRPLSSWRPRRRAASSVARSLTAHLLCKYPVPALFDEVWDENYTGGLDWYLALAQGRSLHGLGQAGEFPVLLSRRQAHLLTRSPAALGVPTAVRCVQLRTHGSNLAVGRAFAPTTWGRSFARSKRRELRRAELVAWMAKENISAGEIRSLVRFFELNPRYTGLVLSRSRRRVVDECREWESAVGPPPPLRTNSSPVRAQPEPAPTSWSASGIEPYRLGSIEIVELLDAMQLLEEGRALGHCVRTYALYCARGQSSIWSLRADGTRFCTIEVRLPKGEIVQMRSLENADPGPAMYRVVRRWAAQAGLGWSSRFNRGMMLPRR